MSDPIPNFKVRHRLVTSRRDKPAESIVVKGVLQKDFYVEDRHVGCMYVEQMGHVFRADDKLFDEIGTRWLSTSPKISSNIVFYELRNGVSS